MTKTFSDIQADRVDAMKNDKTRSPALALMLNEVRQIAKSDGNREVVDGDVITAATRIIKKAKESLSYMKEDDAMAPALRLEIDIASEFLPAQMSEDAIKAEILSVIGDQEVSKKLRGPVMKHLNQNFRGQFDSGVVNTMLTDMGI